MALVVPAVVFGERTLVEKESRPCLSLDCHRKLACQECSRYQVASGLLTRPVRFVLLVEGGVLGAVALSERKTIAYEEVGQQR